MKTTIKLFTIVLGSFFSCTTAQVGINTASPTKTLDVNGNMRIRNVNPMAGSSVLTLDSNGNIYKADGVKLSPALGEIKYGMQKTDHAGWYLLDGRATATISSVIARNNAITLYGSVLHDSRNRYLKYTGGSVGTVGGNNTYNLTQSNMPSYSVISGITGSAGNHDHTADDQYLDFPGTTNSFSGTSTLSGGFANFYFTLTSTSSSTSTNIWNHSHTASGSTGGSGQAFSVEPAYITANVFVYLGQ
ncbi:hypothetical protein EG346_19765 [Chryseobacterium carnipullorum]|uniref:Microcystin-dependent protein n=1 Tax=Chryseobacterium carnipullorum TaxID=1124835 RepID=A0A376E063_CHRCU|nr:hypothetical protein [Chryseobacterium carnipullorum]AZA50273.1 hypothetical protein EG346_19765 [Chryseobacterium carnipullorum]AZA65146.1 hypothetical protein EG345_10810 [Chryseobacterium carnipullorum]STC98208.1 Uncharacterised protein [Chryseobacterium carnipullorum]